MSPAATVLSFGRGVEILRGPESEAARKRRIAIQRQGAFRRAIDGEYCKSDLGLFGPAEQLLRDGPGMDPRLHAGGPPAAA